MLNTLNPLFQFYYLPTISKNHEWINDETKQQKSIYSGHQKPQTMFWNALYSFFYFILFNLYFLQHYFIESWENHITEANCFSWSTRLYKFYTCVFNMGLKSHALQLDFNIDINFKWSGESKAFINFTSESIFLI